MSCCAGSKNILSTFRPSLFAVPSGQYHGAREINFLPLHQIPFTHESSERSLFLNSPQQKYWQLVRGLTNKHTQEFVQLIMCTSFVCTKHYLIEYLYTITILQYRSQRQIASTISPCMPRFLRFLSMTIIKRLVWDLPLRISIS